MTVSNPPILSVGVMCGDVHVGILERCLKSVIKRCDEIVVGWNGQNHDALISTIQSLGYSWLGTLDGPNKFDFEPCRDEPPIKVVAFQWPGRFDVARNIYWPHLSGEWRFSIDCDDILANPTNPDDLKAIETLERDYGLPPPPPGALPPLTLKDWLTSLPPKVNCVFSSYDYIYDENGYVMERQKIKRLVRRSVGHIWSSPEESGIHEILVVPGAVPEFAAENLGILLRHFPTQAGHERVNRNIEIVQRMTSERAPYNARHAYDLGNVQFALGQTDKADQAFRLAIQYAPNDLDRYVYRLARAQLQFLRNLPDAALQEAFAAITLNPDAQEAYFVVVEALSMQSKWPAVVEWYERAMMKRSSLLSREHPLLKFIAPRGQAAAAYMAQGKFDKAYQLAQECMERYPKSPQAQYLLDATTKAVRTEKLHTALLDAVDTLIDEAPALAKTLTDALPHFTITRGLARGLRARTLKARVDAMPMERSPLPDNGVFTKAGERLDLEALLTEAKASERQLLTYAQETPKSFRITSRLAKKPSVAFYCPSAVELWTPDQLNVRGLGGSESSVAHLAREVARRGHPVEVYTPHGVETLSFWHGGEGETPFGMAQKDLTLVDQAAEMDVVVACRAPYLAREMDWVWKRDGEGIFCWHQDNGYGNAWMWCKELAEKQKHLHVSAWARKGLLTEAYGPEEDSLTVAGHFVMGNGVDPSCANDWSTDRKPHRVVYCSDPSRGLEDLLAIWPDVRAAVPDAELHVYCGFTVMLALQQDTPGSPVAARVGKIRELAETLKPQGVHLLGWNRQEVILRELKEAGIYAYPGGLMPEGYGVALAQAAACGCDVLFPAEGALPEVLHPLMPTHFTERDETERVRTMMRSVLTDALVQRLKNPLDDATRRQISAAVLERHAWPRVADRFLKFIGA